MSVARKQNRKKAVPTPSEARKGGQSARAIRSAARREAILRAALDEFSVRGFAAARHRGRQLARQQHIRSHAKRVEVAARVGAGPILFDRRKWLCDRPCDPRGHLAWHSKARDA